MKKNKKLSQIKAEQYAENEDLDIEIEDDTYEEYYEDDYEDNEVITENSFDIAEEDDDEDYEDAKKTFKAYNTSLFMKIFNIAFIVSMLVMILICIDVVCVARYNVGPFFAIKTKTYEDGGTKVYYGIGYKVIKYNQIEGRKDISIGSWNLPYSTEPTPIEDIDLAIEFQNNPQKASKKYYKQYLEITSNIKNINKENNALVLEYTDPDGKYTLLINCSMASNKDILNNFPEKQEITVRGTAYDFTLKNGENPNTVYMSNCFVS